MAIAHPGELAALATAFCWTISSLTFSSASRRVGSLAVNLIRLVLAWLMLAAYGLAMRGQFVPLDAPPHTWGWLTLSGLVGFFVGDLCLFRALVLIGPRLSMLLMSVSPPMAAIAAWLVLGQRLSPLNWAGMAITLAGVAWVVLERTEGPAGPRRAVSAWGVFLGITSAAGQAVGLVLSTLGMAPASPGGPKYDPVAATQIRALAGIAGFAVLLAALHWYPKVISALRQPKAMGQIALGAFMGPFLGVSLLLLAIQTIPAGVAQTLVAPIPVMIIPFVIVLYHERVSRRAILGACLAVCGVAVLLLAGPG